MWWVLRRDLGLTQHLLRGYSEVTKALVSQPCSTPMWRLLGLTWQRLLCYSAFTQMIQSPSSAYSDPRPSSAPSSDRSFGPPPRYLLRGYSVDLCCVFTQRLLGLSSSVSCSPCSSKPFLRGYSMDIPPWLLAVALLTLYSEVTPLPGCAQPIFWGSQLLLQGYSALAVVWYLEVTQGLLR